MDNVIDFQAKKENPPTKAKPVRGYKIVNASTPKRKMSLGEALNKYGSFKGLQHRLLKGNKDEL